MTTVVQTKPPPLNTGNAAIQPDASCFGAAGAGPLTDEQLHSVHEAKLRRQKLDQAATFAAVSGWITAVIAALAAPFALFSWVAAVMVVGLSLVAYHEFKGRRLLRALDRRGPRVLGFNQIALGVLVIAYSVWHIVAELRGEGRYAEAIANEPMLADTLGPIGDLVRGVVLVVYASLIVGTVIFQGGAAWYYFSRAKHLRAYVEQTPGWVVELVRRGA